MQRLVIPAILMLAAVGCGGDGSKPAP
ncbi:MAG: hypothetical protein RLZZ458_3781, partial [Planctomycetota bacterium]